MKRNILFHLSVILSFLLFIPGASGQNGGAQLRTVVNRIFPSGGQVTIDFDMFLSDYTLSSNNQLILSPVLADEAGNERLLPEVILNGRHRNKLYQRMQKLNGSADSSSVYKVIRVDGKTATETVHYQVQVPYERWMGKANVQLYTDLCGCAGVSQTAPGSSISTSPIFVGALILPQAPTFSYSYIPEVSFIEPPKEEIKKREESGSAYIIFRQGQSVILPDYQDNRIELDKITASLDYIKGEPTAQITSIKIEAYASPEGTYQSNLVLSQRRAAALRDYVSRHYSISSRLITAKGMGENWSGLEHLVESDSGLENQSGVLQLIRSVDVFDGREKRLMELSGGRPYRYMLQHLFPLLRRSDYRIEFTVPEFSTQKSSELLHTRPGMLSLNEMYQIANKYEKGSAIFNEVFEIALKNYPADRIANLNAAAACLLADRTDDAEHLLTPYADDSAAWNNLGVLYMKQARLDKAENYLKLALSEGSSEAAANYRILMELKRAREEYQVKRREYDDLYDMGDDK